MSDNLKTIRELAEELDCSYAINLQGRRKSVRKSSIRAHGCDFRKFKGEFYFGNIDAESYAFCTGCEKEPVKKRPNLT